MNFDELISFLPVIDSHEYLFVGLGNELKGDDYAGIEFLYRLEKTGYYKNSGFINAGTSPENYLEHIINSDYKKVIFIDSAKMGKNPGEIAVIEQSRIINSDFSTHAYSISIISDYLHKQKPFNINFIGIEPLSLKIGNGMSETLSQSIDKFFISV